PALPRPAILPLAIAVVVIAMPAGTEWRIHFEHGVHDAQRVLDQRVVESPDPVTHQFEESRIHDVLRGELERIPRRAVPHLQEAGVRVLIGLRITGGDGGDADEMTGDALDEGAGVRDATDVPVTLEEVCALLQKSRRLMGARIL